MTFTPLDQSTEPENNCDSGSIDHAVVQGMWQVVNGGGTGGRIKMAGFDIAGKTGTAQVVGLGKDTGKNKDHSWFVSYAPAYKPEIAMVALIENSGFGGITRRPRFVEFTTSTIARLVTKNRRAVKPQIAKKETTDQKKPAATTAAGQQTAVNNQ